MAAEAAILLKDVQGEKIHGKIAGLWKSSSKTVYRGELILLLPRVKIIPRKDGKPAHNYQLASDPSVTLFCPEEDLAPMSDYEYHLMVAIKSREARYEVFQKEILDWGSKLQAEMVVQVTLPSKTAVPSQHALAIIRYIGPLPNENGVQFGVEIMEGAYRRHGSSNGFFGGQQFFKCDENCALFVPLDRLSPTEPLQQTPQEPLLPASDPQRHPMTLRSQNKAQQSDLDQHGHRRSHSPKQPHSQLRLNDRVVVHDKNGTGIHGTVRWIDELTYYGGSKLPAIGVETDIAVQSKDFVGSLHGMGQHFKCSDSRHGKLVMPESLVILEKEDAAQRHEKKVRNKNQESGVDVYIHAHERAHAEAQFGDEGKIIQQVKEQSEDEYLRSALNTHKIDRDEQARILNEIEREKKPTSNRSRPGSNQYEVVDPVVPAPQAMHQQPPTSQSHGQHGRMSPSVKGRQQDRSLQKLHDQHSVQDEHLLGHRRGGDTPPLRTQRSMPGTVDQHQDLVQPPNGTHQQYQAHLNPPSDHPYHNIQYQSGAGGDRQQPFKQLDDRRPSAGDSQTYQNLPPGVQIQHGGGVVAGAGVQPGAIPSHEQMVQQQQYDQQQYDQQQYEQQLYEQQLYKYEQQKFEHQQRQQRYGVAPGQQQYDANQYSVPNNQQQPPGNVQQLPGMTAKAVAPQETILRSFSMGSTVQLQSNPPRYGVIQWMGTLPDIEGRIAGVELEEPMDGCSDGSWNGKQYFNCPQGHGFFCPVSSLAPDQRFAQPMAVDVNPLDGVAMEESRDQFINPGQIFGYIGEGKGIQGHQNSCYLDSTVFGLFALSDVFDNMFLEQKAHDPAGDQVKYLLWKGIVNPLRKNGVVRHESVMKLRNKLEELGKMKGVNQDEKDPEEFLNMLFKHTLHVPPFINIKRPVGVEQEYFVQLFVEHDESLKLPTVGDLLSRMFKEQKIRFTKVPSKLLIQIPRYGREFKTYQKTIPSIKLELKGLLTSKHGCFICADSAWKECRDCTSFFTQPDEVSPEVVYFCENCAKLSHGKGTKREHHVLQEVAPDAGKINELDLLSVICIETSHYICFTRSEDRWVFFDSMANRVNDMYNIPKVVDCTDDLNEWVYPANGDYTRLLNTPPRGLPEYVRRFTQDIYLCVYIQPDVGMYGDFEDDND